MKNVENMKRLPVQFTESVADQLSTTALEKIKNTFGKDYKFNAKNNGDGGIIAAVTEQFIKKYDTRFKDHSVDGELKDARYVIKLDNRTFAYIATGMYSGSIEKNYFMNIEMSSHDLHLYIFGRKMKKYVKEMDTIIHNVKNSDELGIYTVTSNSGSYGRDDDESKSLSITYEPIKPRDINNTIFFSHGEKEKIMDNIDKFVALKDFYEEKQVIYKIGFIFYGVPGTGKSSLVRALSTYYNRPIISVDTTNIAKIDLNQLSRAINLDEGKEYIVLFEDFDTIFIDREALAKDPKLQEKQNAMIHDLQQFFDSNTSPNNVIFIATTNYMNKIDKSLVRGGRLDTLVEIKSLDRSTAIKFCKSFKLDDEKTESVLKKIEETDFFKASGLYNQSSLQKEILNHCEIGEIVSDDEFSDDDKVSALEMNKADENSDVEEEGNASPETEKEETVNLRVTLTFSDASHSVDANPTINSILQDNLGHNIVASNWMLRQNKIYVTLCNVPVGMEESLVALTEKIDGLVEVSAKVTGGQKEKHE